MPGVHPGSRRTAPAGRARWSLALPTRVSSMTAAAIDTVISAITDGLAAGETVTIAGRLIR